MKMSAHWLAMISSMVRNVRKGNKYKVSSPVNLWHGCMWNTLGGADCLISEGYQRVSKRPLPKLYDSMILGIGGGNLKGQGIRASSLQGKSFETSWRILKAIGTRTSPPYFTFCIHFAMWRFLE